MKNLFTRELSIKTFIIPSDVHGLGEYHKQTTEVMPTTSDEQYFIMAINELVANAAEHGNRWNVNKIITIDFMINKKCLLGRVQDEGIGFDWREKMKNEISLEGNKERGLGIPMIKKICNFFVYNKSGNKATIIKYRDV